MSERRDDLSTADLADVSPATDATDASGNGASGTDAGNGLLPADAAEQFRSEWADIQSRFVDEPRGSVQQADRLVADVMQRLAASFSEERNHLEEQWDRGDDVSTESLRVALTRYRSFFQRLLAA